MKLLQLLRLYPYLLHRRIRAFCRKVGYRPAASRFVVVNLSGGAVMVWTAQGNIVLTDPAARLLADKLPRR